VVCVKTAVEISEESRKDLKDKPILVESYTEIERVRNLAVLNDLVSFMKRMGKEAKQAAVAVVINNVFHEITNF
jgi:NAD(P)H-dependent FMN reductase